MGEILGIDLHPFFFEFCVVKSALKFHDLKKLDEMANLPKICLKISPMLHMDGLFV